MKNFYVTNEAGAVVRHGHCSKDTFDLQANAGETVHEGVPELPPMQASILGDGYLGKRIRQYPSIADQLDSLWHAMEAGEIPKAGSFYDAIKAVKDANPKD